MRLTAGHAGCVLEIAFRSFRGSTRAVRGLARKKKVTSQPPEVETADTPACSKAQVARRLGA